jgi:hypothetical protein
VVGPHNSGALVRVLFRTFHATPLTLSQKIRREAIAVTDERVRAVSEIITSIKLVKLYAWDQSFADKVAAIRAKYTVLIECASTFALTRGQRDPANPKGSADQRRQLRRHKLLDHRGVLLDLSDAVPAGRRRGRELEERLGGDRVADNPSFSNNDDPNGSHLLVLAFQSL